MKRILYITLALLCLLGMFSCTRKDNADIVGKWIDTETEQVYEYTADGYYYEYSNENFTSDKTRYKVSGDEITYYIDDAPESGFSVKFEINGSNLVINDEIIYKPYTDVPQD